jgi:hypothetical protein
MLVGVLLGDAHIGKVGLDKAFISFEQSKNKSDYLLYLHKLISEGGFELENIKNYSRNDPRYPNRSTESLYFRTKSLSELKPLADLFLDPENKKIIPTNIAEMLTPRSLAFWIMDDGQQVKRGGVTLCTDSFKSEEVGILRNALNSKFNLITSIHNKKGNNDSNYERIYINKSSLEDIKPLLKEHMHESMLYKINENQIETTDSTSTSTSTESDKLSRIMGVISDIDSDIGDF